MLNIIFLFKLSYKMVDMFLGINMNYVYVPKLDADMLIKINEWYMAHIGCSIYIYLKHTCVEQVD